MNEIKLKGFISLCKMCNKGSKIMGLGYLRMCLGEIYEGLLCDQIVIKIVRKVIVIIGILFNVYVC